MLLSLVKTSPLDYVQAAEKAFTPIEWKVVFITQGPQGCYVASVAVCGAWNKTLSGTPEEMYDEIYRTNGNSPMVSVKSLKLIGYKQITKDLSLEKLYEYLKQGPVIIGEKDSKGNTHYATCFAYCPDNDDILEMSEFKIQDTKKPNWRLSDSKKLSNDGICTLEQWIKGSQLMSFTYYSTGKTTSQTTVEAPAVKDLTANTCKLSSSFSSSERVMECGVLISMSKDEGYELFGKDKLNGSKGTSFYYTTQKHYHPLFSNMTYYAKSYVITESGTTIYSPVTSFTTPKTDVVKTTEVKDLSPTSATLYGSFKVPTGTKFATVGMLCGSSLTELTVLGTDQINGKVSTAKMWYNTSKFGKKLTPGEMVVYVAFATTTTGITYYGEPKMFTVPVK